MRVIFLCGSLAFGKDGVGDYTLELAHELVRLGGESAIISLNDRHCEEIVESEEVEGKTLVKTLRLPSIINWKEKILRAQKFIEDFKPDWLSLQYVPYAFHKRGMPFTLPHHLRKLGKKIKWHVMFHELWIGISSVSPIKHRVIGNFQRNIALSCIRSIRPALITTSNLLYQDVLTRAGIFGCQLLPLFSNIKLAEKDSLFEESILKRLNIHNIDKLSSWRLVGIFGSLHPEANLAKVISEQYDQTQNVREKLAFLAFGRMSSNGLEEFRKLENTFKERIPFLLLGEQSSENISRLFQLLNYGISTTPIQHIGKSGVYAAMRFHGLKVLHSSFEYLPEYNDVIQKAFRQMEDRKPSDWSVNTVANKFLLLLL